jgi:hypothetical protein
MHQLKPHIKQMVKLLYDAVEGIVKVKSPKEKNQNNV